MIYGYAWGEDTINLRNFDLTVAELTASFADVGTTLVISFAGGEELTLINTSIDDVVISDFLL